MQSQKTKFHIINVVICTKVTSIWRPSWKIAATFFSNLDIFEL